MTSREVLKQQPTLLELAQRIYEVCHIKGSFTLRSGRKTNEYFDKYQFEALPELVHAITNYMVDLIPRGTEVLAGLEMGGIPVVTMLSSHSGLPAAFVRKRAKEHGTVKLSEGAEVRDRRVLVVEDVVTSGGQISASTNDLKALGAKIECALCVIDRQEGAREALARNGIELISLFTRNDFPSFRSD